MNDDNRAAEKKILVIVGPTAAGKTELAANLGAEIDGEIVSADSMQVYQGMDIGTSKPSKDTLSIVPHHLIDCVKPSEEYSVAKFQTAARQVLADIFKRGRQPIIAGGSGLYVRAIIDPMDFPTATPESPERQKLEELAKADPEALIERLVALDPEAAQRMDTRNIRRVIRAIEAVIRSGETYKVRNERFRLRSAIYDVLIIGLRMSREKLYGLIDDRVDDMVSAGLEDEVRRLMTSPSGMSKTARQGLGYKEFIEHIETGNSREQTIELIKRRTRQFAKRQLTWFRADPRIVWLEVDDRSGENLLQDIMELVKAKGFIVS